MGTFPKGALYFGILALMPLPSRKPLDRQDLSLLSGCQASQFRMF